MTKMFDNYDNPHKECIEHCPVQMNDNSLKSYSGTEVILNALGKEIGLAIDCNSAINLTFDITGTIKDDSGSYVNVEDFINSHVLRFEFLNFINEAIIDTTFEGDIEQGILRIELCQETCCLLNPGVYRIRLRLLTDNGCYTLFAPEDAMIHIY